MKSPKNLLLGHSSAEFCLCGETEGGQDGYILFLKLRSILLYSW